MSAEKRSDLTAMLDEMRAGFPGARDRLVQAIYDDLVRTAGGMMRRERPDHTLEAGALVNEALLRLLKAGALAEIRDGRQLHAAAVQVMRQVLVDHSRRHKAGKRGGRRVRVPLDQGLVGVSARASEAIDLDEALELFARAHPRQARVVRLRYFSGMSIPEAAETLDVSHTTVESDWRFARAWLHGQLGGSAR